MMGFERSILFWPARALGLKNSSLLTEYVILKHRWATDPIPRSDIFDDSNMILQGPSNPNIAPKMSFIWEIVKF